jgi:hypothetical protein
MNVLEFERLFQKTNQILFIGSNGDINEPLVISALFRNKTEAYEAYDAYEFLKDNLTKDEIHLLVRVVDDYHLSLSFIDKINSNVYNIDNILYQESNLIKFREEENIGYSFCFLIMELIEDFPAAVLKPGDFPLTIKELSFAK